MKPLNQVPFQYDFFNLKKIIYTLIFDVFIFLCRRFHRPWQSQCVEVLECSAGLLIAASLVNPRRFTIVSIDLASSRSPWDIQHDDNDDDDDDDDDEASTEDDKNEPSRFTGTHTVAHSSARRRKCRLYSPRASGALKKKTKNYNINKNNKRRRLNVIGWTLAPCIASSMKEYKSKKRVPMIFFFLVRWKAPRLLGVDLSHTLVRISRLFFLTIDEGQREELPFNMQKKKKNAYDPCN